MESTRPRLERVLDYPLTLIAVSTFVVVNTAFILLSPNTQTHVAQLASTSLYNLTRFRIWTFVISIPLLGSIYPVAWTLSWVVAFAIAERHLGWKRTLAYTFAVHVIVSIITEGGEWVLIATHNAPNSHFSLIDIGPSYIVVSAVVLATFYIRGWWKLVPILALVTLFKSPIANPAHWQMDDSGHALCIITTIMLYKVFESRRAQAPATEDAVSSSDNRALLTL